MILILFINVYKLYIIFIQIFVLSKMVKNEKYNFSHQPLKWHLPKNYILFIHSFPSTYQNHIRAKLIEDTLPVFFKQNKYISNQNIYLIKCVLFLGSIWFHLLSKFSRTKHICFKKKTLEGWWLKKWKGKILVRYPYKIIYFGKINHAKV